MIPRPIRNYFFFGTAVRYLQDAKAGWRIVDVSDGWYVRSNLEQLFAHIEELGLKVTGLTHAAGLLRGLLNELADAADDATLTEDQATRLVDAIGDLRPTLEAELKATYAYSLTPKRIDIHRLVESPAQLLGPGTFERLPEIAQFDVSEAARCIAFERPTAAAFHLMRATEAALRAFYAGVVKRRRRAKMWGEIIVDLRARPAARRHISLLNHLDHIRTAFRNPTQHPEAKINIDQAQDLWSLVVDVLNRMAPYLPRQPGVPPLETRS